MSDRQSAKASNNNFSWINTFHEPVKILMVLVNNEFLWISYD